MRYSQFDTRRMRRVLALAALGLLVASQAASVSLHAAEPSAAPAKVEHRAFGPSGDPVIDARAAELGHKLRCPVCQGMPIAESPATMAVDMMQQVRKMLAQGQSDADIIGYFTSRYGQWVLLEPPHDGFALWVWLLPPLCCLGLLILAWRIVARLRLASLSLTATSAAPADARASAQNPSDAAALLAAIRQEVDES